MKIMKTYSLSEKSLEKDIDKFVRDAMRGAYQYDYRHGQDGLKIIKAYFRLIDDEFKNQNFQTARACYEKLLFLLLQSDDNYFDYEDIMSKFNSEKIVGNYFKCLIKICSVNELFVEFIEYLKIKEDYYFESAEKNILSELSPENRERFMRLVEKESEKVKENDYELHDLIFFQLYYAKQKKDRKRYFQLCEKYIKIVGEDPKSEF
jgi:hypothetical protein